MRVCLTAKLKTQNRGPNWTASRVTRLERQNAFRKTASRAGKVGAALFYLIHREKASGLPLKALRNGSCTILILLIVRGEYESNSNR
jgi:hypothetical protein